MAPAFFVQKNGWMDKSDILNMEQMRNRFIYYEKLSKNVKVLEFFIQKDNDFQGLME